MTSLFHKEILLTTDAIQHGRIEAWRAIDRHVRLFWLVVSRFEAMQHHSTHSSAHAAMTQANAAFARRRLERGPRDEIPALRRDLLRFRRQLAVTEEDAVAAGFSPLAIGSFCNRMGLGRAIPGWLAALLIRVEPDISFALLADARRRDSGMTPT